MLSSCVMITFAPPVLDLSMQNAFRLGRGAIFFIFPVCHVNVRNPSKLGPQIKPVPASYTVLLAFFIPCSSLSDVLQAERYPLYLNADLPACNFLLRMVCVLVSTLP